MVRLNGPGGAEAVPEERNGAWRLLLPARPPGPVALIGLDPAVLQALLRSYPDAIVVPSADDNGRWHAGRAVESASMGLVVADERRPQIADAGSLVKPGGVVAAIVPSRRPHDAVLLPRADALERVMMPGWPATSDAPGQWLRQRAATTPLWRVSGREGLAIRPRTTSVVDEVVADVGRACGGPARLRGFLVSGGDNVVLRVALPGVEAAVRVAITELGVTRLHRQSDVVTAVTHAMGDTELRRHMPAELASGTTAGFAWRAESWHQGHLSPRGLRWSPRSSAWARAHHVERLLSESTPTGRIQGGWARSWVAEIEQFGQSVADKIEVALAPIERERLPRSWCHGDLWPGNVILGRCETVLIDWEQGRPDAPCRLDGVFLELNRLSMRRRVPIGVAASTAVQDAGALSAPPSIAGRAWDELPADVRAAMIAAAFVVHALGPQGDRRGSEWAARNIAPLLSALRAVR